MRRLIVGFLTFLFLATPLFASDSVTSPAFVSGKVLLNSLIQEALKNNPRLKAARYRLDAAKARISLFRNIPDPMLEYEYDKIIPAMVMPAGEKVRPMKSLAVSQEIPFPTKIFMRKKVAQKEANALEQEYKETERAVIKEIKEVYFTLYLNRQKVDYLNEALSLLSQFVEVINKKYAVNKASQTEVLRAQVEYSKLSNSSILYEQEVKIAQSLLISLLGREENASLDIFDVEPITDLEFKEADIIALVKNDRPELKSVREMLEKARVESSLSKQEFIPDITVKYKRDARDGKLSQLDQGEWAGMIGINVPIWFWGKQLAGVREARANFNAAKADYQSAENTAVFEAKSAFAKYEAARKLVEIYETGVLPQATSSVATAQRAYESGTLSFLEMIDSLRMLRELQMEYFESVAELQIALADLEQAVGGNLVQ